MRIGVDIRHLTNAQISGVGHYTVNIVQEMIKLGSKYEFLLFASGKRRSLDNLPIFTGDNISLQKIETSNRWLMMKMKSGLTSLDELTAMEVDAWFFPNINIIKTKKPYVITAHDLSFKLMPEYFSTKQILWHKFCEAEKIFQEAEKVICVSEATKNDLGDFLGIEENKLRVIELAAEEIFEKRKKPNDEQILRKYNLPRDFLLMIGTLEPRKNHLGVIEAYEMARRNNWLSEKLVLIGGKGYKAEKILKAKNKSDFSKDIFYIGYVESADRPAIYRFAKQVIFPSFYEGFGLPIVEALKCGTPVLTSANSSMVEIADYKNSLAVNPFHIGEIAEAMKELKNFEKGFEYKNERNWKMVAQETLDLFDDLEKKI